MSNARLTDLAERNGGSAPQCEGFDCVLTAWWRLHPSADKTFNVCTRHKEESENEAKCLGFQLPISKL